MLSPTSFLVVSAEGALPVFLPDSDQALTLCAFALENYSILGPIVGGFIQANLNWRWCIWVQLIFGVFVQALHFLTVPETRTAVLIDRIAKKRRQAAGGEEVYGPNELVPWRERFEFKEIVQIWLRPFKMFLTGESARGGLRLETSEKQS